MNRQSSLHNGSESSKTATQQSVHPTLGSLRSSQAFFYALPFFPSDGVPPPAPARVTQTVRQPKCKNKIVFESQVRFFVEFRKTNSSFGFGQFFSGGICKFFLFSKSWFGFSSFGLVSFVQVFKFSFCHWSKFWLIVACDFFWLSFCSSHFGSGSFFRQGLFLAKSGFQD